MRQGGKLRQGGRVRQEGGVDSQDREAEMSDNTNTQANNVS